jgi:hypothetical protein
MTSHDRRLAELHEPRRNRYFSGKLLAPSDLQMEQDYGRGGDAQLARLVLGAGVVCGLEVTAAAAGDGIRVAPGLALDGWGRRIVVPCAVDVNLPYAPPLPATMAVRLHHRTREADLSPAAVGHDEEAAQAGTWIEDYDVEICEAAAPAPAPDCGEATLELIRAGQVAEALALLARMASVGAVSDPGVTLATITASADAGLTVDPHGARGVVPTNVALLQLIACLAARVEDCCAHHRRDGE